MKNKTNLIDDCKKFLGIYPHNVLSNVCVGDPYFYKSMCERYGTQNVNDEIKKLEREKNK